MRDGATLVAPETVFLSADTRLGRDVVVEPNVVFGPGVDGRGRRHDPRLLPSRGRHGRRGRRSSGRSRGCGPARALGQDVHIGNFVEVKNADARSRARRPTTSPISATRRSARRTNVGAGTITCNYDGVAKHRTDDRRERLHRLQLVARRAGHDRRRRLCRLGLRHHRGRAGRRRSPSAAGRQVVKAGLGDDARGRRKAKRDARRRSASSFSLIGVDVTAGAASRRERSGIAHVRHRRDSRARRRSRRRSSMR